MKLSDYIALQQGLPEAPTDGQVYGRRGSDATWQVTLDLATGDGRYAAINHNHDGVYSPVGHNHDGVYSPVTHNHDGTYAYEIHTHSQYLTDAPSDNEEYVRKNGAWAISSGGGTGGGDADTLNGFTSDQFLRSDVSDTATGKITFTAGARLNDNDILEFGNSADMELFVDGSHAYMDLNSGIGNFYIRDGTTTRFTFDDAGHFTATGNITASGNVTAYSDRRLKKNIQTIDNALSIVRRLRGVKYDKRETGEHGIGLIAQEVKPILPQVVHADPMTDYLSLAYGNLVGVLVEAIKELEDKVNALSTQ